MNIKKLFLVFSMLTVPAFAAEGIPGATIANDGAKPPYGTHGAMREACKADPEKCRAQMQAQREACKADPEKCRQERRAQREKMCAQDPERCKEMKARMEQRRAQCQADPEKCRQERRSRADERFNKADVDRNGMLSRAEAGQGSSRLARHFDAIDVNGDGQLSRDELQRARDARHGAMQRPPV